MIRPYQTNDLEELLDLWFESSSLAHPFLEDDFMAAERKNIRDIYLPITETWIFEEEEKMIGFISMIKNEVGAIFIWPHYQRKGIGKELLDFVSQKFNPLEVEVFEKNDIGRAFYEKYGFKFLKKFNHEGSNQMVLRLEYYKSC